MYNYKIPEGELPLEKPFSLTQKTIITMNKL